MILFKNFTNPEQKFGADSKNQAQASFQKYSDLPTNLGQLYFDAIEERNFTQIKIDMFSTAIRRNIEQFGISRRDILEKIDGKKAQLKIMSDMNQSLKRKYIKKNVDYKKALRGENVDEPKNFFQQLVFDIKKDIQMATQATQKLDQKLVQNQNEDPLAKTQELTVNYQTGDAISISTQLVMLSPGANSTQPFEDINDQIEQAQQLTANKAKMQQQIRQLKHMEQLEVKTISERSHEDSMDVSMSMTSSKVNTPGGHHKNYLSSGTIQRKLQGELDADESAANEADQQLKRDLNVGNRGKKIQILDLLNEICEEVDENKQDENDTTIIGDGKQEEEEVETEREENRIIEQIMRALQIKDNSDEDYNSLISTTDGIYLQNINSDQLETVIKYLYNIDDPEKHKFEMPQQFNVLMNLFETAEYLGLDQMKVQITLEILKKDEFQKYTNVRRHYIDNLAENQLEDINQTEQWAYVLGGFYRNFTKQRIEYMEKMKDDESFRFVFDEDLQYLTKEYYDSKQILKAQYNLQRPLILFSAFEATSFAICSRFSRTLLSLELRACSNLTDKGIIQLCEGLSGIKEKRNGQEPTDEFSRYRQFNRHETLAKLKHLNIADLKQITNRAMKSISFNLFPELVDLSIWGCYKITNEGFLELCTAYRSENFRRVNYCGCYKISDDSRLWISSSFSRVVIYNKVDDFGKELNLNEVVPPQAENVILNAENSLSH
ncbi:UNKNOWN [Stylonychia lemnae]|uniref:Uncharacterized protein n=1 Tax=Stylonychia lemnae TaxID=5949 RepID=A0A078AMM2_STYLE|nr:UNKNOWN [Stylonychia lemnae]|eukprot:CDW82632.1 UNKNOWN [Stylonychia lemnae]